MSLVWAYNVREVTGQGLTNDRVKYGDTDVRASHKP